MYIYTYMCVCLVCVDISSKNNIGTHTQFNLTFTRLLIFMLQNIRDKDFFVLKNVKYLN